MHSTMVITADHIEYRKTALALNKSINLYGDI